MENASKALIIAGAILLAILIIALGVFIFNQASDTANTDQLVSTKADAHNRTFQNYEGSGKKGSQVNSLIDEIRKNNQTCDADELITLEFTGVTGVTTITPTESNRQASAYSTAKAKIDTNEVYTISIEEFQDDGPYAGWITKMKVTKETAAP